MCESQTYGKVEETPVNKVGHLSNIGSNKQKQLGAKDIMTAMQSNETLAPYFMVPHQLDHFKKLDNGQEKFKYINQLIAESYANDIAQAYEEWKISDAQELENAMTTTMATASQIIFGNPTNPES